MYANIRRFVVGTIERPTVFLTRSGEVSECPEDAWLFETLEAANDEIKSCDEPEVFKVYSATITINGV